MSALLTGEQLAAELGMSHEVVLRWRRHGRIKAEYVLGRSPRFDLAKVKKQLIAETERKARESFNGMIPTL
jgi:predicted site-specific integrase-resolvase